MSSQSGLRSGLHSMTKPTGAPIPVVVGLTVLSVAVGALLGRWTAPPGEASGPETAGRGARSAAPSKSATRTALSSSRRSAGRSAGQDHDHSHNGAEPGDGNKALVLRAVKLRSGSRDGWRRRLHETLDAAVREGANPDDHEAELVSREASGQLLAELQANPEAVAGTLARMASETDRTRLAAMSTVLGQLRDPEVENAALKLAESGDPARQEAALDILDAHDSPKAIPVALRLLGSSAPTEVRRAALRAIPESQGQSVEQAGAVVTEMARVLQTDADPESRRRAAIQIGLWHREPADLSIVLSALRSDRDVNVRAGCAYALELAMRRDAAVVNALASVLGN